MIHNLTYQKIKVESITKLLTLKNKILSISTENYLSTKIYKTKKHKSKNFMF
jgi:hypothetical protein